MWWLTFRQGPLLTYGFYFLGATLAALLLFLADILIRRAPRVIAMPALKLSTLGAILSKWRTGQSGNQ